MPEKIFTAVPFARDLSLASRPNGLEDPPAAGVQGRARTPEEMATVEVGHSALLAVLARSVKTADN
jgi:hypothetical protein